jgi:hypothetical protein
MNITQIVEDLTKERDELQAQEDAAHKRIIEINAKLRRFQTVLRDAKEILSEDVKE